MEGDDQVKEMNEEHWRASEAGDIVTEHAIYAPDAILDDPQSGERFDGRSMIAAQRAGHPADRHSRFLRFAERRTCG